MPELPDVEIFTRNLDKIFAGRKLLRLKIVNGHKLKDKSTALSKELAGKTLQSIYRSGKEMRFQFSDGTLLGLHLMLTGDIFKFEKKNEHKSTIVEFYFEGGIGLALTDRMKNANIKLNPIDKLGIDALSPQLNFKYLKEALNRQTSIKNILLDQDIIRGIGNGYSDEILWATKISPFSIASAIPDDKIKELAKNIKKELKSAIQKIGKNFPDRINDEVKKFLKIHTKEHTHSPGGALIKMVEKSRRKTFYTDEQVLYS